MTPSVPAEPNDSVLETLLLPFAEGTLRWPSDGALFVGARDGWPLYRQSLPGLVCEQDFKPAFDALARSGHEVRTSLLPDDKDSLTERMFPMVLVLAPRQRDAARATLARALARTPPGGIVVACAANDEGAKSLEADLARIGGPVQSLSKNKCRVFWTSPSRSGGDAALAAQWRDLDAPRQVVGGRFVSRPGLFAWDRIDPASALLAAHLPSDLSGRAADLGAGFGFLSAELLARCPAIASLHAYEADARAVELARINLARTGSRASVECRWADVTMGLEDDYDVVVMNPPFHAHDRLDRPDIGRRFIAVAAASLVPGGRLWMVANRHLPYEAALGENFGQVRVVAQRDGFKVVEGIRVGGVDLRAAPSAARRGGRGARQ